jgi:hypothetical protein
MGAALLVGWVIFAGNCALWGWANLRRLRRDGHFSPSARYAVEALSLQLAVGITATVSASSVLTVLFVAMTLAGPLTVLKAWIDIHKQRKRASI